jgi:Zn-dependent protease with chaperone function
MAIQWPWVASSTATSRNAFATGFSRARRRRRYRDLLDRLDENEVEAFWRTSGGQIVNRDVLVMTPRRSTFAMLAALITRFRPPVLQLRAATTAITTVACRFGWSSFVAVA